MQGTAKKVGAPPIKHNRAELTQKLNQYIDDSEIPILAEFCYKNGIRRSYIYEIAADNQEVADAIKKCQEKKESQLEQKALKGEVNPIMAIFSLKQLGWTDRQEIRTTAEITNNHTLTIEAKLTNDAESAELIRKLYQRQQALEIGQDD